VVNFKPARSPTCERESTKEGKLRDLPRFGEKERTKYLKAPSSLQESSGRFHVNTAEAGGPRLFHTLKSRKPSNPSRPPARCGEAKRPWAISTSCHPRDPHLAESTWTRSPSTSCISRHRSNAGTRRNKVSSPLGNGLQVDVELLEKENFGAAFYYGSKGHKRVPVAALPGTSMNTRAIG